MAAPARKKRPSVPPEARGVRARFNEEIRRTKTKQERLAAAAGIDQSQVSRFLKGERTLLFPGLAGLLSAAAQSGVDLNYVFGGGAVVKAETREMLDELRKISEQLSTQPGPRAGK